MASFKGLISDTMGLSSGPSASDLTILLTYLSRDKNLVRYNPSVSTSLRSCEVYSPPSQVVVFKAEDDRSKEVSQEEITIASLKQSVSELQQQINSLASSIVHMSEKAKDAVAQKNKAIAISALRSKSLKTKTLGQRTELLNQLEETLSSIEQATDQLTLVNLMKDSVGVLKNLHRQVGDVDQVQDITEQLKEETMKVEEINEVIQEAGKESFIVDEDEIEQELDAMLEESKSDSENAEMKELESLKPPQSQPDLPEKLGEESVNLPASAPPTESTASRPAHLES